MPSPWDKTRNAERRMLGAVPDGPALGRGPAPDGDYSRHEYDHPAAGWGAARSVARVLEDAGEPVEGFRALFVMSYENGGFDCPGCGWPDDPDGLRLDMCENSGKHVTPREHGLGTVATIEAIRRGEVKVFVALRHQPHADGYRPGTGH